MRPPPAPKLRRGNEGSCSSPSSSLGMAAGTAGVRAGLILSLIMARCSDPSIPFGSCLIELKDLVLLLGEMIKDLYRLPFDDLIAVSRRLELASELAGYPPVCDARTWGCVCRRRALPREWRLFFLSRRRFEVPVPDALPLPFALPSCLLAFCCLPVRSLSAGVSRRSFSASSRRGGGPSVHLP